MPPEIFLRMLECGESPKVLQKRILAEGDPFTDKLYDIPGGTLLRASYSRFVADLNRERDEGGPNGVIKTTDFQLRPLYGPAYRVTNEERERRLREYFDPFHEQIGKNLATGTTRFLLDGHSMTVQGPAMGPDEGRPRPALCLGNFGDGEGEPIAGEPVSFDPQKARQVRDYAIGVLSATFPGWDRNNLVLLNKPFEGGHILRRYSHPDYPYHVPGIMFEINRVLYLDEETLEPLPGAIKVWRNAIAEIISFILKIPA